MEQTVFNTFLAAFIDFHRTIGIVVMICLILWYMSGRRLDPWAYTTAFVKTCMYFFKKLMKICEVAAKETASRVPTPHARWRPLVFITAQFCYCALTVATMLVVVSRCAR